MLGSYTSQAMMGVDQYSEDLWEHTQMTIRMLHCIAWDPECRLQNGDINGGRRGQNI